MPLDIRSRCESWLTSILNFHNSPRFAVTATLAKGRGKLQFVSILVKNATADSQTWYVRIQFYAVLVPHRKLLFGYPRYGLREAGSQVHTFDGSRRFSLRCNSPLMSCLRLHSKYPSRSFGCSLSSAKRTIGKNLADTNLPELPRKNLQVVDQSLSPWRVPRWIGRRVARTEHQN